ncbi:MAG: sigma-54-dependent Fis family transcriptional regulator [bacterium]|nr:MAG: sigma-54-dependent Fis family transcriptional regulator [bacterium]
MAADKISRQHTLLAIDDEPDIRDLIYHAFSDEDYHVMTCGDCTEALALLERGSLPDLILLDLMLPEMSGLDFLQLLRNRYPHLKAIVISARGDVETVVEALQMGALDYIHKPFDVAELMIAVNKALSQKQMAEELDRLRKQEAFAETHSALYASREMANIIEMVSKVAQTDVPVLITGESGVGKEVIAREIHQKSLRASGPFLKVNCAALPASLLESELFGYNKGAFTGASQAKPSKFENADNGTLFLDEIGEIAPALQAKFLHVLQDGFFNRLGSNKTIRTNTRILVATNQDLEEEVKSGSFRSDLYYRLNVVRIHIPPLRERPVDIALLANYYLDFYSRKYRKEVDLSESALPRLNRHSWPGNVRELQNVMRRYVVLGLLEFDKESPVSAPPMGAGSPDLQEGQIPGRAAAGGESGPDQAGPTRETAKGVALDEEGMQRENYSLKEIAKEAAQAAEKEAILRALEITRWNKSKAAKLLKISYKALLYKMREGGLEKPLPEQEVVE